MMKFLSLLIFVSILTPASAQNYLEEGFDRQSPEEIEKANREIQKLFQDAIAPESLTQNEVAETLRNYDHLDPKHEIPSELLKNAVLYFDKNKSKFPNKSHFGIIDYKPRSDQYRFFVINWKTGKVEKFHTTHGRGSDLNDDGYAERFLNVVNSHASSIGYARTAEVYWGAYKRSLRLDGLSSTNSKIRERAVVVHGWDGAYEANVIQGLSRGCPALDWSVKDGVIDKIKEGALLYMAASQ